MCLGIPMQVQRCEALRALCLRDNEQHWIDLSLVGPQPEGTWLLTFLGTAREVLDATRAQQVNDALLAVSAVMAGQVDDLESLFADLTAREPQLPAHLRNENNDN